MSIEVWLQLAQAFGVSTAILGLIAVALWRVAAWSARRIDKLVDRHITLMDKIEMAVNIQTTQINLLVDLIRQRETTSRLDALKPRANAET